MEEIMKKAFTSIIVILALSCIITSCGGGDGVSPIKFSENFESYSLANPWTPVGWTSAGGATWAIVSDSGNKVLSHVLTSGLLTSNIYSGSNYTVSAKIKPGSTGTCAGVIARFADASNYFMLSIETPGSLVLRKYSSGTGYAPVSSPFTFNTTTYYTLTLQVNGNNISGSVTDGVTTESVNFTDDGATYGPFINSGRIGVAELVQTGTYFDDILVTEP